MRVKFETFFFLVYVRVNNSVRWFSGKRGVRSVRSPADGLLGVWKTRGVENAH